MSNLRQTRTYAAMEVSEQTFVEIKTKLEAAGYDHCIQEDDGDILLDMQGIALIQTT